MHQKHGDLHKPAKAIFDQRDDEFHVRVTNETEEIKKLLEAGFKYVLEKDGSIFLRKRK